MSHFPMRSALVVVSLALSSWAPAQGAAATGAGVGTPSSSNAPKPIDQALVATDTGAKPEVSGATVKVSFPRTDIPVEVDGWANMPPFMGLTSWAAFIPGGKPEVEALVMGDLVLFEDEVNPAMSAALDNGLEVTALHNHFFFDKPRVFFMHIAGKGSTDRLARAVKTTLDAAHQVRGNGAQPASRFGTPPPPTPSHIDGAKLDALFGVQGSTKDGMYKAVMGRKTMMVDCDCSVGGAMGINTWAAFAGTNEDAVVDGDFAVSESELQPVLKALRAGGIDVVAIHSHMTGESPRILFLHYWGRGAAADLAGTVKRALDRTAWDRPRGT
jgi:hypothetical protein